MSTQTIEFGETEVLLSIHGSITKNKILFCTFGVQDLESQKIREVNSTYEDTFKAHLLVVLTFPFIMFHFALAMCFKIYGPIVAFSGRGDQATLKRLSFIGLDSAPIVRTSFFPIK
ncbi:hypothetical protein BD410DRAFT_120510 [Rickenella mellea]|uniref:Uncharacterized protein n=1 Tax=Rickenella mellea TaxID=50990 RepID=A0A4Y7PJ02_9AGAM|nr:hypothetical protein BD410DRAFT_120510 [Rickenella mellea]